MKNYYGILGIETNADNDTIKESYQVLVHQYLPNRKSASFEAALKIKDINEAYRVLLHPVKRKKYDEQINPKNKNILDKTETKILKDKPISSNYWSANNESYKGNKKRLFTVLIIILAVIYASVSAEHRILTGMVLFYFLPTLHGLIKESCTNQLSLFLRNLFFGWTVIYWLLMLIEVSGSIESKDASRVTNQEKNISLDDVIKLIEFYGKKIEDDRLDFGECIPDVSIDYALDWLNLFNDKEIVFLLMSDVGFTEIGIYVRHKWRCRYEGIENVRLSGKKIIINDNYFITLPSESSKETAQILFEMLVAIAKLYR